MEPEIPNENELLLSRIDVTIEESDRSTRQKRSATPNAQEKSLSTSEQLVASLSRIEELLGILVRQSVRPALAQEFEDPISKAIYLATGDYTAREIAQKVGVGIATVSRAWARFEGLGLVMKEGSRYRRIFK